VSIVYDQPKYYEVAFSFREIGKEVDVFEECIKRYARVPVQTFMELACGNSPHMTELVARNYRYIGLDLNDQMINYSRRKVTDPGKAVIVKGDMCRFGLNESAEFAFVALGSLYAQGTDDLLSHFQSVARVLPSGGLYLLDWCVYFGSMSNVEESWEMEQQGIHLRVKVQGRIIEPVEQRYEETITLEVADNGQTTKYSGTDVKRIIYPQEFLLFIQHCTDFEFIGWWNNWSLNDPLPSPRPIQRPIVLLRRR
jgi:SAM-dependent methyltransferase